MQSAKLPGVLFPWSHLAALPRAGSAVHPSGPSPHLPKAQVSLCDPGKVFAGDWMHMALSPSNTGEKPCLLPPLSHESSTHRMTKALAKMNGGWRREEPRCTQICLPRAPFATSLDLHILPKKHGVKHPQTAMFPMRHLVLQGVGRRKPICICFKYKCLILKALISPSVFPK